MNNKFFRVIYKYILEYFLFLNDHMSMILTKIVSLWVGPGTSAIWTIGDYRWLFHTDFHPTLNLLLFVGLFFSSNQLINYSTLLWLKELFVSRMDLWDSAVSQCNGPNEIWIHVCLLALPGALVFIMGYYIHTYNPLVQIFQILPIYIHNSLSLSFSVQYTEQNQEILLHELHWQRMHVQIS